MLKQRRLYADHVAASLFDAETAIDAALGKTAALAGVMPTMRAEAGISALVGQGAYEWASKSILALTEARRAIVEAHKELSIAQKQIGLGAVAYGDPDKPEDPGVRTLHAVAPAVAKAS
jgi:hypothetical protein